MSPTCSSRFFVGRNARSATARTTPSAPRKQGSECSPSPPGERLRDRFWAGNWEPSRTPPRKLRLERPGPWYVATALDARGAQGVRAGGVALAAFVALGLSACGGAQQDAQEPSGKFK